MKKNLVKAGLVTALISSMLSMTSLAGTWKWVERGVETGWQYLNDDGTKASGWILDNGKYYYIGDKGYMLMDTTTPDGFKVDKDGVWIEEVADTSLKQDGYITIKWDTFVQPEGQESYTVNGTTHSPVVFTQQMVSDIINTEQYKDKEGNIYKLKRTSKLLGLMKGSTAYYLEKVNSKDYNAHISGDNNNVWTEPDSKTDVTYTIDKNAMITVPKLKKPAAADGSTEAVEIPEETITIADFIAKRQADPNVYKGMEYGMYKSSNGQLTEFKPF